MDEGDLPNLPQEGDPPGQNADRVHWRGGGCGVGFGGHVPLGTAYLELWRGEVVVVGVEREVWPEVVYFLTGQ